MTNYAKHETDEAARIVRETFSYDPNTGDLIRLNAGKNFKRLIGNPACRKWTSTRGQSYMTLTMKGRIWFAHRIAWLLHYGHWPHGQIDHKNTNSLDNNIQNLVLVSNSQNCRNKRKQANRSGHTGVYWRSDSKQWRAQIRVNQKLISLGSFDNINDAVNARKTAELEHGFYHGRGFQNE